MPVLKKKWIKREDLRANPEVLFLFGDNAMRIGMGGQAGAMRGEPNAVGIRTKWAPGCGPGDYFNDAQHDRIYPMILEDLEPVRAHLKKGGAVVIPEDGLGTGLSRLPDFAPEVHSWLCERLEALTYAHSPGLPLDMLAQPYATSMESA